MPPRATRSEYRIRSTITPIYSGVKDLNCRLIQVPCSSPNDPQYDGKILERLLDMVNWKNQSLGDVVVLGSGDGQWNKVVDTQFESNSITSYLWWNHHERPALRYHSKHVHIITRNAATAKPIRFDTLLCNLIQDDPQREIRRLAKIFYDWLLREANPELKFIVRLTNFREMNIIGTLNCLMALIQGNMVGVVANGHLSDIYWVSTLKYDPLAMANDPLIANICLPLRDRTTDSDSSAHYKRATWQIPRNLPVHLLAPLDMGATIEGHLAQAKATLNAPLNMTKFYKEIGWYPKKYAASEGEKLEPTVDYFLKPIYPLLKPSEWHLTSNDATSLSKTFLEKYDCSPVERHAHYKRLWEVYKGIAMFLRNKGVRLSELSNEEIESRVNRKSSMGFHDKHLGYQNLGEYIDQHDDWRKNVAEFKFALAFQSRPIKADFHIFGTREVKKEPKTRIVWNSCATQRLYESKVLGKVEDLLLHIPFAVHRQRAHQYGELFYKLMNESGARRAAICDDISAWDTRVSYSLLCLESEFLGMLTDDETHKIEIRNIYRLYAFALVNVPRELDDRQDNVLYQVQGQVQSGRRVTYAMNTITNLVLNMSRAAMSQGVNVKDTLQWVHMRLLEGHSPSFGGKICGDDSLILLGQDEAKLFADEVRLLNQMGMKRKDTGWGPSKILNRFRDINFCNRHYVRVPIYNNFRHIVEHRYVPTKPVDEILMRKLIRPVEDFDGDEQSLAWIREQARDLLVEHFHVRTVRVFALAVLSATPSGLKLDGGHNKSISDVLGDNFTKATIVQLLNDRLFGEFAFNKSSYRAKKLSNFGYMSHRDARTYDLDNTSDLYRKWLKDLDTMINQRRKALKGKKYDNWLKLYDQSFKDPALKRRGNCMVFYGPQRHRNLDVRRS